MIFKIINKPHSVDAEDPSIIKFPAQPDNVPIDGKNYALRRPYQYTWNKHGRLFRLIIPRGFVNDAASVPRVVWTVSGLTPDGLIRAAAVPHDFISRYGGEEFPVGCLAEYDGQTWVNIDFRFSNRDNDRLFGRLMREVEMKKWRRRMAYRFVRMFSWIHWDSGNINYVKFI